MRLVDGRAQLGAVPHAVREIRRELLHLPDSVGPVALRTIDIFWFGLVLWVLVIRAADGPASSRRIGQPQDMAGVCVFLASDASSYVNGAQILCDGGAFRTL